MALKLSQADQEAMVRAYRKRLEEVKPRVDNLATRLTPEIYIKSKTLVKQSVAMQNQLQNNLALISRINTINRTAGFVNCWEYPKDPGTFKQLRKVRMIDIRRVVRDNKDIYRLIDKSKTTIPPRIKSLPPKPERSFGSIENNIETADSSLKNISGFNKYWMDFETNGGVHLGRMTVELFDKKCPMTCQLFKKLIKGTPEGRAYGGTRVYLIVPGMFCSLGDVVDNDGFGEMILEEKFALPENFILNHYSSGILSMPVHRGYVNGMFNITFRAMPLLDGKAVVFGRVVSGKHLLGTFSDMGTPSGMVTGKLVINQCGWINKRNKIRYGAMNTTLPQGKKEENNATI